MYYVLLKFNHILYYIILKPLNYKLLNLYIHLLAICIMISKNFIVIHFIQTVM